MFELQFIADAEAQTTGKLDVEIITKDEAIARMPVMCEQEALAAKQVLGTINTKISEITKHGNIHCLLERTNDEGQLLGSPLMWFSVEQVLKKAGYQVSHHQLDTKANKPEAMLVAWMS